MSPAQQRLRSLQRQLVELINLLDPDGVRFPQFHRQVHTP
jgi:Fe-S-cluster formation regulator IscX/YfhJ